MGCSWPSSFSKGQAMGQKGWGPCIWKRELHPGLPWMHTQLPSAVKSLKEEPWRRKVDLKCLGGLDPVFQQGRSGETIVQGSASRMLVSVRIPCGWGGTQIPGHCSQSCWFCRSGVRVGGGDMRICISKNFLNNAAADDDQGTTCGAGVQVVA